MKSTFFKSVLASLFAATIIILTFSYGIAIGLWKIYPYEEIRKLWGEIKQISILQVPHHLFPARFDWSGVKIENRKNVFDGYTLITGPWKVNGNLTHAAKLIDINGNEIHEWRLDSDDIWTNLPRNKGNTYIHGTYLFPNGDLLLNLEYAGLIKIDKNGDLLWKTDYQTHHSIFRDEDGNFWIPGLKEHYELEPTQPFLKPPIWEDVILKVSPKGDVIDEISILGSIYQTNAFGLMREKTGDLFHLNKILVFSEKTASHFDSFQTGDILLSLRHLNTIMVLDGKTHKIKWSMTRPFVGQHDPILTHDGKILVFNNYLYDKNIPPGYLNGSQILEINPETNDVSIYYKSNADNLFYTSAGGKHQVLPNGNHLITEARTGRIFEIDKDKNVVWSWVAPKWDDYYVPEILEGRRYPKEYLEFLNDKDSEKQETKNPQKSE